MAKWGTAVKAVRSNAYAFRNLVSLLIYSAPISKSELAEQTGLGLDTIGDYLAALRKPTLDSGVKLAHIAAWGRDKRGAETIPLFAWGDCPDAERRPRTNAERRRAYRERQKLWSMHTPVVALGYSPTARGLDEPDEGAVCLPPTRPDAQDPAAPADPQDA